MSILYHGSHDPSAPTRLPAQSRWVCSNNREWGGKYSSCKTTRNWRTKEDSPELKASKQNIKNAIDCKREQQTTCFSIPFGILAGNEERD